MEQLQRLVRLTSPVCVVSSCYLNPNTHRSRIGLRIATIAGSVIGGVAFLIILFLSIIFFCRSRWRRHERPPSNWTIDHVPSVSHRHSHHNNSVSESMTANRASRQFASSDGRIIPNTTPVLDQPSADTSDKPALDVLRHEQSGSINAPVAASDPPREHIANTPQMVHVDGIPSQPLPTLGVSPRVMLGREASDIRREFASLQAEVEGLRAVSTGGDRWNDPPPAYAW